jgi:hypothetical protein
VIQGVHAETIVFSPYQRAHGLVAARDWPTLGTTGKLGGRELELAGKRPRRFRMHVTDVRARTKSVTCQLELHDAERVSAPLMKLELSFVPDGGNTRISLVGSTARALAPASSTQGDVSRQLANQYARALLDQIAQAIEKGRPADGAADGRPRSAIEAGLHE